MTYFMKDELAAPQIADRRTFETELDALRVREKAHTHEGDAIAAARRRLPMIEGDAPTPRCRPHPPPPPPPADDRGERFHSTDRPPRVGPFAGHVRGSSTTHRLLLHVAHRPSRCRAVRGLHVGHHPSHGAVLPAFSRHYLRRVLPRPIRTERSISRLHGLGHALVLRTGVPLHAARWSPHRLDAS